MCAAGGAVMEPHGESVLKAGGRGVRGRNSGGSLDQIVKAGSTDSKIWVTRTSCALRGGRLVPLNNFLLSDASLLLPPV